jgi:hypothetical protein
MTSCLSYDIRGCRLTGRWTSSVISMCSDRLINVVDRWDKIKSMVSTLYSQARINDFVELPQQLANLFSKKWQESLASALIN